MIIDQDCSLLNGIKQQLPEAPAICERCTTLIKNKWNETTKAD